MRSKSERRVKAEPLNKAVRRTEERHLSLGLRGACEEETSRRDLEFYTYRYTLILMTRALQWLSVPSMAGCCIIAHLSPLKSKSARAGVTAGPKIEVPHDIGRPAWFGVCSVTRELHATGVLPVAFRAEPTVWGLERSLSLHTVSNEATHYLKLPVAAKNLQYLALCLFDLYGLP